MKNDHLAKQFNETRISILRDMGDAPGVTLDEYRDIREMLVQQKKFKLEQGPTLSHAEATV